MSLSVSHWPDDSQPSTAAAMNHWLNRPSASATTVHRSGASASSHLTSATAVHRPTVVEYYSLGTITAIGPWTAMVQVKGLACEAPSLALGCGTWCHCRLSLHFFVGHQC